MMKMMLRRGILIGLIMVTGISLAGCSQVLNLLPILQTPTPLSTPVVSVVETPLPAPSTDLTAEPPALSASNIIIWLPPDFDPENGSPEGNLFSAQLKAYEKANPGITVTVRIKSLKGPGGLLDSLTTASLAAPGALPALLVLPREDFEVAARNGLLMPLVPTMAGADPKGWFPFAEDLTTVKSERYGLPFAADVICMSYKTAQIAYPPTTWQDMIQPDVKIMAFPAADPQGTFALLLYMSRGGRFGPDSSTITLKEDDLQQSLKFLSEGANANVFPYWLSDYTGFDQSWAAQQDSSATYGVIWASQFLDGKPENTVISKLPSFDGTSFTFAKGWVLAFPLTSPERFDFYQPLVASLTDTGFQARWSEAAGLIPANEAVLQKWKDNTVSSILLDITRSAVLLPTDQVLSEVGPLFKQATIEMLRKQTTYIESSNKIIKALSE